MTEHILEEQYAAYTRDGDLAALGRLFDQVAPELARLAGRLAPDSASAEDLVQETFLTALERPGLYDPARPLLPWLLGILTHRAREARRSAARRPEPDRLAERSVPEPDAILADAELRAEIEGAVDELPDSLRGVMEEIGRVYAPAQRANARAVQAGEKTWEAEIDGAPWTQRTFPYQAKCLQWTNDRYRALSEEDRASVDALLQRTGVETMLSLA